MNSLLTEQQLQQWRGFREFADRVLAPVATAVDEGEVFPLDLVGELGRGGWLSAMLPTEWGGGGLDMTAYGFMSEELGRVCSNARNFVAVQDMVSNAIWRWGSREQKKRWLPDLAAGRCVAAFLLTEPGVGSDAQGVTAEAHDSGSEIVVSGTKKWISFGQCANVLLAFVQYEGRHTALLIDTTTPGIHVEPLSGMLGLRGSMLAEITFDECRIPPGSVVGRPGTGLVFVASSSLEIGRYSTAWGCVGLAQACLSESSAYAAQRVQSGKPLADHQLVQRILADMIAGSRAARLLCWQAGAATEQGDPDAVYQTLTAKYFASTVAARIASQAVQVHGARGMGAGSTVGRLFRDAKAMELIEGTTETLQQLIGRWTAGAGHPAGTAFAC